MPIARPQGKSEPKASPHAERYLPTWLGPRRRKAGFQTTRKPFGFASRSGNGEQVGRVVGVPLNTCCRLVSRQLWKIFAISPSCKPTIMACSSGGRT